MTQSGNESSMQRNASMYRIPQPRAGSGSGDLHSESNDPNELRDLLARARERLAFYEGFDRIISENIKRSGELMLETIDYREQAEQHAQAAKTARAELDAAVDEQRQRHHELMSAVVAELDNLHSQLDAFRTRIEEKLHSFSDPVAESANRSAAKAAAAAAAAAAVPVNNRPDAQPFTRVDRPSPEPSYQSTSQPAPTPAPIFERQSTPAPAPVFEPARPAAGAFTAAGSHDAPATQAPSPAPAPAPSAAGGQPEQAATAAPPQVTLGPRTIDAMFHGITDPSLALQLQRYLKDIRGVTGVEVREFAEGLLRMRVNSNRSLNEGDFSSWPGERRITLSVVQPTVLEASVAPAADQA